MSLLQSHKSCTTRKESFTESFLSLGCAEPATSWGVLINDGAQNVTVAWWRLVFPTSFLVVTLFCLTLLAMGSGRSGSKTVKKDGELHGFIKCKRFKCLFPTP